MEKLLISAADQKTIYTAAEVAALILPLSQSIEALQKENADLKRKLEHMTEVFTNAQKAQQVSPVKRKPMFWAKNR